MSRLGRGLEALLPKSFTVKKIDASVSENSPIKSEVIEVEIGKITANPYQPRKNFDQEKLSQLAQSINHHGILQPLLVTKTLDGKYELLIGERRLHAAKLIGLKTVPVIIKNAQSQKKLELALVENLQRHDLNPIEEAMAFARLSKEFNLTQEEIAKKVGKSRSDVANIIRILTLPEEVQKAIFEEKISLGHAKAILGIEDGKKQIEIMNQIINYRLPVRDVEDRIKKVKVRGYSRGAEKSQDILQIEEQLRIALGTRVNVKKSGHTGQIIINFYSEEELSGLVEKICKEVE